MSRTTDWLRNRIATYGSFFDYCATLRHTWVDVAWGAGLPAVAFIIVWSLGFPIPQWGIAAFFVWALIMAGYHSWRLDHMRLVPKFAVRGIKYQSTPTMDENTGQPIGASVYAQLLLKCLTSAPIPECAGHLREVRKWSPETQQWEETALNESLPLGWSHGDKEHSPITLEPDIERHLNLFFVHGDKKTIVPAVHPLPLGAHSVFAADDVFRFDITVRGRDCAAVNLLVRVRRGDSWDKPVAEIIRKDQIG
jgi:hypothetical protein